MGENEQGGMLRTVVIVGLVALIAAVIIGGIVGMKASMTKNTATAVDNVEKVPKPFDNINGGNVSVPAYAFKGIKDGQGNGVYFPIQIRDKIAPGYWREISIGIKPEQDSTVQVDINNYDLDNPNWDHQNDNDNWGQRDFKLYENGTMVSNLGKGFTTARMKANHTYKLVLKYHNTSNFTIYDAMNNDSDWVKAGLSHILLGTMDGSAGKYNIFDSEYATYKLPANS